MISAEEERAKFHFLAAPTEILGAEGKVTGIKCQHLSLTDAHGKAEFDSSARKRPVPVEELLHFACRHDSSSGGANHRHAAPSRGG